MIPVCNNHQRLKEIGRVNRLIARCGWSEAEFSLDTDMNELEIGQPVSLAVQTLGVGSGIPFITEVSVVQRGAVKGAVVRNRRLLPIAKPEPPKPITATPTLVAVAAPKVIRRDWAAERAAAETAELNRRLDWLEQHTGRPADTEAVIVGMQRELNGASLDDLARDRVVHPLHDGIIRRPLGQVLGVR